MIVSGACRNIERVVNLAVLQVECKSFSTADANYAIVALVLMEGLRRSKRFGDREIDAAKGACDFQFFGESHPL